jgi:hypothetical protein
VDQGAGRCTGMGVGYKRLPTAEARVRAATVLCWYYVLCSLNGGVRPAV